MATVHPGPDGDIAVLAQTLLGLAGHPRDVVFIPEDAAFEVPDELADKYIEGLNPDQPEQPRKRAGRRAPARPTEKE